MPAPDAKGVVERDVWASAETVKKTLTERNQASLYVNHHGTRMKVDITRAEFEEAFRKLEAAYPDRLGLCIGYDDGLAHRIEAGADSFLMPSRYEPCGLNQIYSLRYGTPPVVRATGGLEDSIDETNGFKFKEFSAAAFLEAIREAMVAWADPEGWAERMKAGMSRDFSWKRSAREYSDLYRRLADGGQGRAVEP